MTPPSRESDSLIGVRPCGCATAWIDLEHSTKTELRDFRQQMTRTGRVVEEVRLDEAKHRLGPCRCDDKRHALIQAIRGLCTDEADHRLIDAKLAELDELVYPLDDGGPE